MPLKPRPFSDSYLRMMQRGLGRVTGRARRYRKYNSKGVKNNKVSYTGKVSTLQLRGPNIIPDRYRCKMKFCDIRSFTGTPLAFRVYRGNSVYDPDYTGVGTNAVGYDQLNTLYASFRVMASKIRVDYVTTNSTVPQLFAILPSISNVGPSNVPSVIANPYCKHVTVSSTAGGEASASCSNFMSTKKMFGIKSIEYDLDMTNASTGTNPPGVGTWYWQITAYSTDGASASSGNIVTTLTYYVEWFDRLPITET